MTLRWTVRRVERELRRHPGALAALSAAAALMTFTVGGSLLAVRAGKAALPALQQDVHVIAYLAPDAGTDDHLRLAPLLRKIPGVHRVDVVRPEEAAAHLRTATGSSALIVDAGVLPTSLEVTLTPGSDLPSRAQALANRLGTVAGIVAVDAMTDGLTRLSRWVALGRRLGLAGTALALLAAAGLAFVAVAHARRSRRATAALLTMLGETSFGVRAPALIASAVATCIGAASGFVVLLAVTPPAASAMAGAVGLPPFVVPTLATGEIALALLLAVGLGCVVGGVAAPGPQDA